MVLWIHIPFSRSNESLWMRSILACQVHENLTHKSIHLSFESLKMIHFSDKKYKIKTNIILQVVFLSAFLKKIYIYVRLCVLIRKERNFSFHIFSVIVMNVRVCLVVCAIYFMACVQLLVNAHSFSLDRGQLLTIHNESFLFQHGWSWYFYCQLHTTPPSLVPSAFNTFIFSVSFSCFLVLSHAFPVQWNCRSTFDDVCTLFYWLFSFF